MGYIVHDINTAPEAARETLAGAKKAYGFSRICLESWRRRRRC